MFALSIYLSLIQFLRAGPSSVKIPISLPCVQLTTAATVAERLPSANLEDEGMMEGKEKVEEEEKETKEGGRVSKVLEYMTATVGDVIDLVSVESTKSSTIL